jgi:DeoR family transcriptional regulator, aga operon transcriptional repressor
MDRVARWNALLEMLTQADGGRLSIERAVELLKVSPATVRRDFDELARQQMLTRTRGGAVANGVSYDLPLRYKTARHASEKLQIAEATVRLIASGEVVGLNGGTTTTEVARALAARSDLLSERSEAPVTVVTNAVNIANELTVRPNVKIVVIGGVARPQSYELIGPLATKILNDITLDVAVLGVDAIDAGTGASAHHEGEASINQLMASRARRVVVVADGSKVGHAAFARIAPIQDIAVLVTDSTAPAEAVRQIEAAGCKVIRA